MTLFSNLIGAQFSLHGTGDTGPIHVCPDPFSLFALEGAGHETTILLLAASPLRRICNTAKFMKAPQYKVKVYLKHGNAACERCNMNQTCGKPQLECL